VKNEIYCCVFYVWINFLSKNCISDVLTPNIIAAKYCEAEMNADYKARAEHLDLTRVLREDVRKAKLPMRAEAIDYISDPLIAINSCDVLSVKIEGNQATAILRTSRLAISKGMGGNPDDNPRQFIADVNPNDESKLNFVLINGEWKIIYPPYPRVGIQALIKIYDKDLERPKNNSEAALMYENQKKSFHYGRSEFEFLKKLSEQ